MSDPEHFLSRWARLKREAAETPHDAAPETAAKESSADTPAAAPAAEPEPESEFDLSTLPSIESITATTDIRAFLAPGVPPELARAALRRAWLADPAIRDFVGIAENQWDFNDPNAIPGFGALGPLDDVRRLVAQVIGGPRSDAAAPLGARSDQKKADGEKDLPEIMATHAEAMTPPDAQEASTPPDVQCSDPDAALHVAQSEDDSQRRPEAPTTRKHGGALPK